ncbi:MAG TPA: LPS export ABC transporter periplasmic protein LptC [Pyrinomonadaceae bacterium]|jgi:LPS export ABC transporter protein LptC
MQEIRRRRDVVLIGVRARAPLVARALALLLLAAGLVYVGISYNRARKQKQFIMRGGPAELSTRVVSRVENFERRVMEGDRTTMLLRAALYQSYEDGHHELTDVHLEYYAKAGGGAADQVNAKQAIYFSETEAVQFTGSVQIETRDHLKVLTERVAYDVKNELANVDAPLTFERENVSGRADAARVEAQAKKLELHGNVEITVQPGAKAEAQAGQPQVVPRSTPRSRPVTVHSAGASFDQNLHQLAFYGGATAEQERDIMSGEVLTGWLTEQRKLNRIQARGAAYLRSMNEGRAAEVRAQEMNFYFDADQRLERATANVGVEGRTLDADSQVQFGPASEAEVHFIVQADRSLLKELRAGGRPVVTMAAPASKANDPRAAHKRLTADNVQLFWRTSGRDLERAEATGNAELIIEPVQPSPQADRKTLNAPRFDCDFYEVGNLAKTFTATGGAKAVITPVQPSERRGVRTLTAQKLVAAFARETQDAERVDASGQTQFNEGDRNGQAETAAYTAADALVRLRGGEPVVWDSRARLKANELDSDTNRKITFARGRVQTTYYSQEQTGGATPFQKVKSPVFVVSDSAEFRHEEGLGIYTGDARAWQDDNFVRGDKLTLRREQKRMEADGNVQSALYNARRKDASGNRVVVPVFATAQRMFYSDTDRVVHYETNVDIKQGTERITCEVADVFLQKDANEVDHTVAQRNVVVTQPGRRGTGDWGQYVAADETVQLTGKPARVEDAEQGNSEGPRMTVFLRENRVVTDSPAGPQSTGRVHSSHKVKKP